MSWINKDDIILQFGKKDYPLIKNEVTEDYEDNDEKVNEAIIQGQAYFKQNFESIGIDTSIFGEEQIDEFKMYLLDYTRWIYSNKDLRMTGEIFDRFKEAKQWVSDVKKGKISLVTIEQDKNEITAGVKTLKLVRVS